MTTPHMRKSKKKLHDQPLSQAAIVAESKARSTSRQMIHDMIEAERARQADIAWRQDFFQRWPHNYAQALDLLHGDDLRFLDDLHRGRITPDKAMQMVQEVATAGKINTFRQNQLFAVLKPTSD